MGESAAGALQHRDGGPVVGVGIRVEQQLGRFDVEGLRQSKQGPERGEPRRSLKVGDRGPTDGFVNVGLQVYLVPPPRLSEFTEAEPNPTGELSFGC